MQDKTHEILTPFEKHNFKLANRFAVAPMTRVSASPQGMATSQMARYYERFAEGGFGLLISEGLYTDQHFSQGYPCQPGLSDLEQAQSWQAITQAVHAHDSLIFAQLMHAGALSQSNRFNTGSIAPSAVTPVGEQMKFYFGEGAYPTPRAMSDEDIADAIAGFADAAQRAIKTAGFDGIEIHAANGYLLDQFLTQHTNQRTDRWGGDVRARLSITLEVFKAIKSVIGNAPLGVRISQGKVNDFTHKWPETVHAAEVTFAGLAEVGVDFIHVTEFKAWAPAFNDSDLSLVQLARQFAPGVTLIANGALHPLEHAERLLQQGADLIALGKVALANPDYPKRLAQGSGLRDFDPALLGPIANIKASELE